MVSESELYMWRAVFAFAFVDRNLSLEEQELLHSYLAQAQFSPDQKRLLAKDMLEPQDVEKMYQGITRPEDKSRFCTLARALAWCEGDLDAQERHILQKVSCLKGGADYDILRETRKSSHLHDYYQHYARSGMMGLLSYPNQYQQRI